MERLGGRRKDIAHGREVDEARVLAKRAAICLPNPHLYGGFACPTLVAMGLGGPRRLGA